MLNRPSANTTTVLPDIESGCLNIRRANPAETEDWHRTHNTWTTRIQSVLRTERGTAWLASECRAEDVCPGPIIKPIPIEKIVIKGFNNIHVSHWGPAALHPFRARKNIHLRPDNRVDAIAPERDIEILSFDVALDQLRNNRWPHTFLRVRTRDAEIICPANYTNFSRTEGEDYIQPITGYVLWHDGEYRVGYVVAHMTREKTNCELVLRETKSVSWLHSLSVGRKFRWVKWLPALAKTHEFTDVHALDARVDLFRYA